MEPRPIDNVKVKIKVGIDLAVLQEEATLDFARAGSAGGSSGRLREAVQARRLAACSRSSSGRCLAATLVQRSQRQP